MTVPPDDHDHDRESEHDATDGSRRTPADGSDGTAGRGAGGGIATGDGPYGPGVDPGSVPDFVAARDHVRESLVRFARSLRLAGAEVPANAATEAARALVVAGFEEESARAALRATLVSRQEDLSTFDRQFPEFWRRLTAGLDGEPAERPPEAPEGGLAPLGESPESERRGGDPDEADDPGELDGMGAALSRVAAEALSPGEDDDEEATASTYSRTGERTTVSVPAAALRIGEGELEGPMRDLTRALSGLRGRRWVAGDGDRPNTRRALRESFATGGTVMGLPRRARKESDVRSLALIDVSRSVLDTVDRSFLLRFLHRARSAWRSTRVFFFDEDVREVTDAFDRPTTAAAVAALERAEAEWGGGTRIGEAVRTVLESYPGAVDRDTVVLVVSDGLEVGDVDDLESGMAELSRRAAATLWLNPLAASPDYEPACRGMAAALPYVDGLFAFGGPDDVAELARQIRLQGTGGTVGYEYDPRRHETVSPARTPRAGTTDGGHAESTGSTARSSSGSTASDAGLQRGPTSDQPTESDTT